MTNLEKIKEIMINMTNEEMLELIKKFREICDNNEGEREEK